MNNLDEVIARTERLPARIAAAMHTASQPISWLDEARDVALRTLMAQPPMEAVEQKKAFAAAVTAAVLAGGETGFVLALRAPTTGLESLISDARSAYAASAPEDRATGLFAPGLFRLENLIQEWVETPEDEGGKRRDSRDWGKTDQEIAQFITFLLVSPQGANYRVKTGPNKGQYARDVLLPHVEEFVRQKLAGSGRVDAAVAGTWLVAVLAAWSAWVPGRWLARVRAHLKEGA